MTRPPILRLHADELIVDSFAGGGGASTGIEWALGRSPDIAINHDPEAIAMHAANHPSTKHYCENVWEVDPTEACGGRPVGLAWFSPDCTFHSKARGAKPFRDRDAAKRRRGLAWVVTRWAKAVKPRVICMENVEELEDWGPLDDDGKPDPLQRGFTFRRWVARLENLGYVVEWRQLRACDYGAPTTRKRLFVIARCDGQPICWPEATHGPALIPHRTAAECIDWSMPCPSIFLSKAEGKAVGVRRPLSDNTLRRIARGIQRFVYDTDDPFIVPGLAVPILIQTSYGERKTGKPQQPRVLDIHAPLGTVVAGGVKHSLVMAFLAKHFGGEHPSGKPKCFGSTDMRRPFDTVTTIDHHAVVTAHLQVLRGTSDAHIDSSARDLRDPMPTVTASGMHLAEVRAFLIKFYGTSSAADVASPLDTITTKDRFGLVMVHGVAYQIVDIGMRMLEPRELYNAQGFPSEYVIDFPYQGKPLSKKAQVRMCGNAVSPYNAKAVVLPNFGEHLEDAMKETG